MSSSLQNLYSKLSLLNYRYEPEVTTDKFRRFIVEMAKWLQKESPHYRRVASDVKFYFSCLQLISTILKTGVIPKDHPKTYQTIEIIFAHAAKIARILSYNKESYIYLLDVYGCLSFQDDLSSWIPIFCEFFKLGEYLDFMDATLVFFHQCGCSRLWTVFINHIFPQLLSRLNRQETNALAFHVIIYLNENRPIFDPLTTGNPDSITILVKFLIIVSQMNTDESYEAVHHFLHIYCQLSIDFSQKDLDPLLFLDSHIIAPESTIAKLREIGNHESQFKIDFLIMFFHSAVYGCKTRNANMIGESLLRMRLAWQTFSWQQNEMMVVLCQLLATIVPEYASLLYMTIFTFMFDLKLTDSTFFQFIRGQYTSTIDRIASKFAEHIAITFSPFLLELDKSSVDSFAEEWQTKHKRMTMSVAILQHAHVDLIFTNPVFYLETYLKPSPPPFICFYFPLSANGWEANQAKSWLSLFINTTKTTSPKFGVASVLDSLARALYLPPPEFSINELKDETDIELWSAIISDATTDKSKLDRLIATFKQAIISKDDRVISCISKRRFGIELIPIIPDLTNFGPLTSDLLISFYTLGWISGLSTRFDFINQIRGIDILTPIAISLFTEDVELSQHINLDILFANFDKYSLYEFRSIAVFLEEPDLLEAKYPHFTDKLIESIRNSKDPKKKGIIALAADLGGQFPKYAQEIEELYIKPDQISITSSFPKNEITFDHKNQAHSFEELPDQFLGFVKPTSSGYTIRSPKFNVVKKRDIKMGVLYVGPNQHDQHAILFNRWEDTSEEFRQFSQGLGKVVDLETFHGYSGKLDTAYFTNGKQSVVYSSRRVNVMFHVAPMMPTVERDPQQIIKKRHIGNDSVHIIYSDNRDSYDRDTVSSNFNDAHIIVHPMENSKVVAIEIKKKLESVKFGLIFSPRVIIDKKAACFVARWSGILADISVRESSFVTEFEETIFAFSQKS